MTTRDRIVLMAVVVIAILGAGWVLFVSPERKKADSLGTEASAARAKLSTAEGQLANARADQREYASAYASVVSLGKAVPPSEEVPSLIYQLAQASNHKRVDFSSIVAGSGSGSGSGSASASSSTSSAASAAAASAGFTQMPFTFVFNGSFFDLEHLLESLNRFTLRTSSGGLQVKGRLLTLKSITLGPLSSASGTTSSGPNKVLSGTISATAYVLPASQGLTGGANPETPGSTTSSTSGASSSPTAPAVARVTP
jgi:hypothetical protein